MKPEVEKIIENYNQYGSKYCIKQHNISMWKLYDILKKENIKKTRKCLGRKYRDQKYLNINADDFINFSTPFHVYILGLLWADGWLIHQYKKKEVRIELTYEDGNSITDVFSKTGKWSTYIREKDNFRKARKGYVCNNNKFIDFLFENDYKTKSQTTPTKIFNKIPENLRKYFILGWSDGDGCFYYNENNHQTQFTFAGSYEQDWSCVENIFKSLNIKNYKIKKTLVKNGNKYSVIRITKKEELIKFGEFLYPNNYEFGLKRKYEKYNKIFNYISRKFK
jgi:hypothetical protein